jgi:hypothetical protein
LAFDKLNKTNKFNSEYSKEDIVLFDAHIEEQLAPCKANNEDLLPFLLQIYSNPVELKISNK